MRTALEIIFANVPVSVNRTREDAFDFIVTDASTSEQLIAGIYVSGASIQWFSEKVTCTSDIAVLEMMAVARAATAQIDDTHRFRQCGRSEQDDKVVECELRREPHSGKSDPVARFCVRG